MNNTDTHAYMQAAVNVMFTQMYANKEINMFGERDVSEMIKQFKQLDEGEIQEKPVVITLNPEEITYPERRQEL